MAGAPHGNRGASPAGPADESSESAETSHDEDAARLAHEIQEPTDGGVALRILADLSSPHLSWAQYKQLKATLLRGIREGRARPQTTANLLRHLFLEAPPLRHEDPARLAEELLEATEDREAIALMLAAFVDRPHTVRPLLDRFTHRPEPFDLLAHLISSKDLSVLRKILAEKLLETARRLPNEFHRWACANPAVLLGDPVVQACFRDAVDLVGPVTKDLLASPDAAQRERLVRLLLGDGSPRALRLLVLGIPFDGRGCPREVLRALGRFSHPLAVAALREVVHRNNTGKLRMREADVALRALVRTGVPEAREFVRHIALGRGPLAGYRRRLRALARSALARHRRA